MFTMRIAAGCMGGNKLDAAAVRKLEKLPTKKQLIGSVAIMVKKVGCTCWAHVHLVLITGCFAYTRLECCNLHAPTVCLQSGPLLLGDLVHLSAEAPLGATG